MIPVKFLRSVFYFFLGVAAAVLLLTQGHYFVNSVTRAAYTQRRKILFKKDLEYPISLNFNEKFSDSPKSTSLSLNSGRKTVTTSSLSHRILCWIMTSSKFLDQRTKYIKETWGPRCDITLYFSDKDNKTFPTIGLYPDDEGKEWLSYKSAKAWSYIHNNHYKDADYFVKADDDTYLIVENLRDFLKDRSPDDAEFFGRQFIFQGKGPLYMSGGASVVLSREALSRLITKAFILFPNCISSGTGEDMKISNCLTKVGVTPVDTRDEELKERFNPFLPEDHLTGNYLEWFYKYDVHKAPSGKNFSSHYPISFHYVRGYRLLAMDYLLYYVKVKN